MKFTDRSIAAIKPKPERFIVWADGGKGFGVRVSPQGKKTFIYMYRFQGRSRMMTLGEYPHIKLAEANEAHAKAWAASKKDIDPGAHKVAERKAERTAETIAELVEDYLEKWAKKRKRSWLEDKRIFDKDVLPKWKHRKARDIQRKDVINLLDAIVDRGAPIQANRTLAAIRKMFKFAIERDIVPYSPCAGIRAPSDESQRDRVLSHEEIKALWKNLDDADMHCGTKIAIKMILTTAQRSGEVVGAEWSEFDTKAGWWTIPGGKTKNGLPHRVPLSQLALELLKQAEQYSKGGVYVFPSPKKSKVLGADGKPKNKHIHRSALGHALNDNLEKLMLDNITPHDLRRTAASHMTSLGIARLTVSKILNHAESGVTAVYDRHSYDAEKCSALNVWAKEIIKIIGESKKIEPTKKRAV